MSTVWYGEARRSVSGEEIHGPSTALREVLILAFKIDYQYVM